MGVSSVEWYGGNGSTGGLLVWFVGRDGCVDGFYWYEWMSRWMDDR